VCLTFSFTLHFTLQLVLLHNKQIHHNILILIKPLEQILLLQPLSQQLRDIEVISIPTSNVPLFLSFPLNPFPPNFILFIRIVFEPLNLVAPTFSCQHCGALFWYEERLRRGRNTQNPKYNLCCRGGRLLLPRYEDPPSNR
jgi:hypothetical protein